MDEIHSLLKSYTLDEEVSGLLEEIVSSRKWQKTFGMTVNKPLRESGEYTFLQKLAKEYEDCKQKEVDKATREQTKALVQPYKIGSTKKDSSIAFDGATPECHKTRTTAARSMGRISTYGAERQRLLSIVALDYPQTLLTRIFNCAKSTVTAARVNCILFG